VVRQVLITVFCISVSGVSSIINEVLFPVEDPMEVPTPCRGKSPILGRFPNKGRCIISYHEVLRSELKNVNH